MNRSTAYATAAFFAATGLVMGAAATMTHLNLIPEAMAQGSGGGGSSSGGAGGGSSGGGTAGGTAGSASGGATSGGTTSGGAGGTGSTSGTTGPSGSGPQGSTLNSGATQPSMTQGTTTQPGRLNSTQPSSGVNPYPGTTLGTTNQQQAPGAQPNPAQPRAGDLPSVPGTGLTSDGRPCNRSGTASPNANLPNC